MIGIVDYGAGNLRSVQNALDFLGAKCELIDKPEKLIKCDKVLLPGVGAFGDAIEKLKKNGLDEAIIEFVKSGKYFLGICLGMQLLFESSDEGKAEDGLALVKGKVVKFNESKFKTSLKIPHIGWNSIEFEQNTPLNRDLNRSIYLYFVHSYHVLCDEKYIFGKSYYGYSFASAVCKDNIFGIQPHPEKSHENGIIILKNFTEL